MNITPEVGRWSMLLSLMLVVLPTRAALLPAQVPAREMTRWNPPTTVGRYSLKTVKQSWAPDSGQIYRYFDGKSSRVEVVISPRMAPSDGTPNEAVRRQAGKIKSALLADRRSGRYDDYVLALDGVHADTLAMSPIPGYRIVAVVRRADHVELVFFCSYALGRSIVQVRALIPQADWRVTDVPEFADQLVAELSTSGALHIFN